MMNELFELELWRIISQGNDESGGYSGGGRGAQRCQSMKPPHGLDDGWVVAETEPEVPCQSSHIGANGDDSFPMPLRLMVDGKGNKIARIIGGRGRDEVLPAFGGRVVDVAIEGTTEAELDHSRIVEVWHDDLKMEGQAKFHCELEVCQLDDLKEEPPRVSHQKGSDRVNHLNLFMRGPHLGVRPVISEIVPSRSQGKLEERVTDLSGRTRG
ncbi:hypothetical protein GOBAR_AA26057 [Gossypium barbadense]|uniref:Uncharacterized protein n=1 Tax=Gossypium barbadense TaxID=3634 RepID=A0A2P5WU78_GOSBA|nr:hypothetical protein GOBAR_AA26057 [Gossypium barbadense]